MTALIVEVAINGETQKARNPSVPRAPDEIAADALACLHGGATMLHTHIDDPFLSGGEAAARYGETWRPILQREPHTILCPTMAAASTIAQRTAHFAACAHEHGARMAPLDPGSMNMPLSGGGAECAKVLSYINTYEDIAFALDAMARAGMGASIGIYEPGFLRAVVAFHRAGKLPPGSFVKLYFFGGFNYFDGEPCVGFGLEPSRAALDAYLEILSGTGLPWAATVVGGCLFESGMARLALESGGHLRVGLEDFVGGRTPTNAALVDEVVGLARSLGRRPATAQEAAGIVGLP